MLKAIKEWLEKGLKEIGFEEVVGYNILVKGSVSVVVRVSEAYPRIEIDILAEDTELTRDYGLKLHGSICEICGGEVIYGATIYILREGDDFKIYDGETGYALSGG